MSPSARWVVFSVALAVAPAIARADPDAGQAPTGHKLTLRLATGVAYLHESWSPNDGNPGSVQSGWAPAIEVTLGRVLTPRLSVGGVWQVAGVFAPTESFSGTEYTLTETIRFVSLAGAFVEVPRVARVPMRAGIAVGAVASSFLDRPQVQFETTFSIAISPYVGYERRLTKRWSIGALARLTLYRSVFGDTPSSATTTGVLPSLMAAFTFR